MREWSTAAIEIDMSDEEAALIGFKPSVAVPGKHEMVKLPVTSIPGSSGYSGILYDMSGNPLCEVANGLIVAPLAIVVERLYSIYGAPMTSISGEPLYVRKYAN